MLLERNVCSLKGHSIELGPVHAVSCIVAHRTRMTGSVVPPPSWNEVSTHVQPMGRQGALAGSIWKGRLAILSLTAFGQRPVLASGANVWQPAPGDVLGSFLTRCDPLSFG